MTPTPPNRCRIVLVAPVGLAGPDLPARLEAALEGGDVASVILPQGTLGADRFQEAAAPLVSLAQSRGAAVIVAGDTRIAGRLDVDGIHVEGSKSDLKEAIERFEGKIAVGAGGAKTRDDALDLGEERPDYIFFGRFGYDEKPEPHPRNLALGQWWAQMIEVPAIVAAGSDVETVRQVAGTGAEFVALGAAVFGESAEPRAAVARANAILDELPAFQEALDAE
ncbi:MAG: thiamine phosphate synthase [Methylobacterium mesophilicum]|nr:thiamine phosphate synthase [Methylobacterium mesophilicum]